MSAHIFWMMTTLLPYVLVLVTTKSKDEAESIITDLLAKKLIVCANIFGPASSFFWWKNKIEEATEFLVFMKSRRDLFEKLTERIKAIHSYEIPEILALSIIDGLPEYLHWLDVFLSQ